jgi:hypothetical protein
VAVCVRVCWSCRRSGGTNVVEIPDVFLHADAYLDMFDSESVTLLVIWAIVILMLSRVEVRHRKSL